MFGWIFYNKESETGLKLNRVWHLTRIYEVIVFTGVVIPIIYVFSLRYNIQVANAYKFIGEMKSEENAKTALSKIKYNDFLRFFTHRYSNSMNGKYAEQAIHSAHFREDYREIFKELKRLKRLNNCLTNEVHYNKYVKDRKQRIEKKYGTTSSKLFSD